MTVALLLIALTLSGLIVWAAARGTTITCPRRLRRRPRELRGDWWPEFERQLREYERRNAFRSRRTRHTQDRRRPPA